MAWLVLSLIGALATSLTTIFAKIGIKDVNSNLATAYRTGVVIVCALIMCFITGNIYTVPSFDVKNWVFLGLSGLMTGCSWLCYYRALKLGSVNKVAPIDKSSFILTSILFMIFFFGPTTNNGDPLTICMVVLSMVLMLAGTLLMIGIKKDGDSKSKAWIVYAILSSVFASLVSLFVKMGLSGVKTDVGTLFRTIVVFIFAITIVLCRKEYKGITKISCKSWIFLTFSGICTGIAWIAEYSALAIEDANPVAVNSIGKLSILLTMLFSAIILREKFTWKTILGLALLTGGIVVVIVFSL